MNLTLKKFFRKSSVRGVLLLSIIFLAFASCKKDKGDEYKVKYTVDCNGLFKNGSPVITYNNESGNPVSENLTVNKQWVKELAVSKTYPIKVNITGIIENAEVNLSVEGYKNGKLVVIGASSQSSTSETALNLNYSETFDD